MDITRLLSQRASRRGLFRRGRFEARALLFSTLFSIALATGLTLLIVAAGGGADGPDPGSVSPLPAATGSDVDGGSRAGASDRIPSVPAPYEGSYAPPFTLTNLEGTPISLADLQEEGKVTLLNFWATWCPPCKEEMPVLQRIHERMGDRVTVVGIDVGEPREDVIQYVEANGYDWTFLLDRDLKVTQEYRMPVRFIPTSYFIGPDGVIQSVFVGPMDEAAIVKRVEAAAAQATVTGAEG